MLALALVRLSRVSSVSFGLLAVASCLVCGCGKREVAPAAEGEPPSSTKSSLRNGERQSDAGGHRHARTAPRDVLEALRLFSQHEKDPFDESFKEFDVYMAVEQAIKEADPLQFRTIMMEVGKLQDFVQVANFRALAIFHLAAGQDLVKAGEIAIKLFPRGEDRSEVLNSLVSRTMPTATAALDFWRGLPVEEQSEVSEYVFLQASVDLGSQGLVKWKDEGYSLNEEETVHMMKMMAISHVDASGTPPQNDGLSEYPDLIEAIRPLEKEGVLSKGAADELILQYRLQAERGDDGAVFPGMPATQALVEEMRKDGFDSLYSRVAAERPHRFFTATGLHDLPEEKVIIAWKGWLAADPAAAGKWFGEQGPELPSWEQDLIRAGFASHASGEGNAEAAREWGSQIADPRLRADTLSQLPE